MSLVSVERRERVAVLTLHDPARRNALTLPMVDEIAAAVDEIEADDAIGAVVVTGVDPAFCAGADLSDLGVAKDEGLRRIYEGFLRIARCSLPTIAAVNGAAVGAGMNLALGCDVRVASRSARFDTRFLDLGLHPGGGHTWMLHRLTGPQVAAAMVLCGERVDGETAAAIGLVWSCVDDGTVVDEAMRLGARAASMPRALSIEAKQSLRTIPTLATHAEAVDAELVPQLWSLEQPAFAERLAALQSKIRTR